MIALLSISDGWASMRQTGRKMWVLVVEGVEMLLSQRADEVRGGDAC
jgi:hypothetical protein